MRTITGITLLSLTFNALAICDNWTSKKIGSLETRTISEASGLVASKLEVGKLIWSNDSGGSAALFASGVDGKIIRSVGLKGFSNLDFEALALGPCIENKKESCIYVGDIGDGIGWRSNFKIGVFKEADFWKSTSISPEATINYSYPKGDENAEAMFVTADGKIIVLSKNGNGLSQIYHIETNARVTHLGQIDLNQIVEGFRGKGPRITDASLSLDGSKVLLLTYGDVVEVSSSLILKPAARTTWKKGTDYAVVKGPGLSQQETITYTDDGSFIVSTEIGDGNTADIYSYSCKAR
jgi:hypothetical protein